MSSTSLRSKVFKLYKSLLYMGRDYPTGYEGFRNKLHDAFMKNKDLTDERAIKQKIVYGNYIKKELEALYRLKKYRAMKKRYYD